MNLIISDSLVNPPTETLAFRFLTMHCRENLHMPVLIKTTAEFKDVYYKWMLLRGIFDYVDDLLIETDKDDGLKLSPVRQLPKNLIVPLINNDNYINLIGKISILVG